MSSLWNLILWNFYFPCILSQIFQQKLEEFQINRRNQLKYLRKDKENSNFASSKKTKKTAPPKRKHPIFVALERGLNASA